MHRQLSYASLSRMMQRDFLDLGPTPNEENCVQIGTHDLSQNILECEVYAKQLERMFPDMPDGCEFFLERNEHDFGVYYEVGILYHPDNEMETKYAFTVETQLPRKWDEMAINELSDNDYVLFAKVVPMNKTA